MWTADRSCEWSHRSAELSLHKYHHCCNRVQKITAEEKEHSLMVRTTPPLIPGGCTPRARRPADQRRADSLALRLHCGERTRPIPPSSKLVASSPPPGPCSTGAACAPAWARLCLARQGGAGQEGRRQAGGGCWAEGATSYTASVGWFLQQRNLLAIFFLWTKCQLYKCNVLLLAKFYLVAKRLENREMWHVDVLAKFSIFWSFVRVLLFKICSTWSVGEIMWTMGGGHKLKQTWAQT